MFRAFVCLTSYNQTPVSRVELSSATFKKDGIGHWTRWSEDVLCCAPLTRDVSPLLYSFVSQAYVRNTAQVREKLVRLDKF